jgi:hypothetical protein
LPKTDTKPKPDPKNETKLPDEDAARLAETGAASESVAHVAQASADAASLMAQAQPKPAPPAPLTEADLRKLADSRATVAGKTDPDVADAIFAMLKDATPEQVAQSATDAAKTEHSTRKIATSQKEIRKAEAAAKVEQRRAAVLTFLKAERAADRFCTGTHRYDIDFDAATIEPVKGKAREKSGGERNAVTKETLAASNVQAFVLVDGSEPTAISRGQTVKAHPYAYMNGAHPKRPYFGLNLYTEGMTEEDAVNVRKAHGLDGALSEGQRKALKNKRLTFGDDPARLLYKLGRDDTDTRVRFEDGSVKTVADFIKSLDAPTPTPA